MLTVHEREQLTALLIAGVGPAEAARRLGKTHNEIAYAHRKLVAAGQAPRHERQPWRPWTPADIDELQRQIDLGYSYDRIARSMRRSGVSIRLKAKRLDYRLMHSANTLPARAAARLLGKGCAKSVSAWIKRKWLKATNAGTASRPLWRVRWDDLLAFMENPDYWLAWDADRVTGDRAFVEWARELRANKGHWLLQTEVAARYHVGRDTVKQWIDKGELPALRYGNHFIHERDLVGFVPPHARPRGTDVDA